MSRPKRNAKQLALVDSRMTDLDAHVVSDEDLSEVDENYMDQDRKSESESGGSLDEEIQSDAPAEDEEGEEKEEDAVTTDDFDYADLIVRRWSLDPSTASALSLSANRFCILAKTSNDNKICSEEDDPVLEGSTSKENAATQVFELIKQELDTICEGRMRIPMFEYPAVANMVLRRSVLALNASGKDMSTGSLLLSAFYAVHEALQVALANETITIQQIDELRHRSISINKKSIRIGVNSKDEVPDGHIKVIMRWSAGVETTVLSVFVPIDQSKTQEKLFAAARASTCEDIIGFLDSHPRLVLKAPVKPATDILRVDLVTLESLGAFKIEYQVLDGDETKKLKVKNPFDIADFFRRYTNGIKKLYPHGFQLTINGRSHYGKNQEPKTSVYHFRKSLNKKLTFDEALRNKFFESTFVNINKRSVKEFQSFKFLICPIPSAKKQKK